MAYPLDLSINVSDCEHCKRIFYILGLPIDLAEADYCPFCGGDAEATTKTADD